ncbi:MAG: hypothetical protein LBD33_00660 [Puniceicoccales bacterium]|nr:hypothetical protein [Puniceicoccales bacterium]
MVLALLLQNALVLEVRFLHAKNLPLLTLQREGFYLRAKIFPTGSYSYLFLENQPLVVRPQFEAEKVLQALLTLLQDLYFDAPAEWLCDRVPLPPFLG